ncbi:MAG: metallophosphoesterase [Alphaproteobacteria bacterium]|nr:metallophosphoesterase [Alphaproteobacteria bacterium]
MSTLRLIQVTDTHLSESHAYFVDNWEVFVAAMEADPPDLIICTGDVSLRGTDNEADLAFARAQFDRLPCKTLVLPGNHDIGDPPPKPRLDKPITEERRERWQRHFGCDWWVEDFGEWRLYGLNAQLFDSGLDAENEQLSWFKTQLSEGAGRPSALFMHKPAFYKDADDEGSQNFASLRPQGRNTVIGLCRKHGVRMIASGHLHFYRTTKHEGIDLIWAPATAFINSKQKNRPALRVKKCIGYLAYQFDGPEVRHTLVQSDRFTTHDVNKFDDYPGSTIYLPPRPLAKSGET